MSFEVAEEEIRERLKQARDWVNSQRFQDAWDSMSSLAEKVGSIENAILAVDVINEAGRSRKFLENDMIAKELLEKGLQRARGIGYRFGEAYALNYIGSFFRDDNEFQKALEYYEEALRIFDELEDEIWQGNVNKNMADCYGSLGLLKEAQTCAESAMAYYRNLDYKQGLYWATYQLGSMYYYNADLPMSLKYIQQAITLAEELKRINDINSAKLFAGVVFKRQGRLNEAKSLLDDVVGKLETLQADSFIENLLTNALFNLAHTYQLLGEYSKAKAIFLRCWEKERKKPELSGLPASDGLGRLALDQGNLKEAACYLQEAVETVRESSPGSLILIEELVLLSTVNAELGRFEEARELLDEVRQVELRTNYSKLLISYGEGFLAQAERDLLIARKFFNESLVLAQNAAIREYEIRALVHLSSLELFEYRISGKAESLKQMREMLEKAYGVAKASHMPVLALEIAILRGLSFSAASDLESAILILEESKIEAEGLGLTTKVSKINQVLEEIQKEPKKDH